MENRHGNRKENSNNEQARNSKKCYSLPTLQRENEKLKRDFTILQAAHNEKYSIQCLRIITHLEFFSNNFTFLFQRETILTESLRKIELLEKENQELKKK